MSFSLSCIMGAALMSIGLFSANAADVIGEHPTPNFQTNWDGSASTVKTRDQININADEKKGVTEETLTTPIPNKDQKVEVKVEDASGNPIPVKTEVKSTPDKSGKLQINIQQSPSVDESK